MQRIAVVEMFPDFLCIGAPRSGTTWLYMNLRQHPDVWLPPVKELHYFDEKEILETLPLSELLAYQSYRHHRRWRRISKSIKLQRKTKSLDLATWRWYVRYFFGLRCDAWYASLFKRGLGKKLGDITPAYGPLGAKSVDHIHRLMPEGRVIFLMRNPIQRAWSHFIKNLAYQKRPLESVPETEFIEHFNSEHSMVRGRYSKIIETWMAHYPKEQFFTAFFEEISDRPEDLLLRIFKFIQVEDSSKYLSAKKVSKKFNPSKRGVIPKDLTIPNHFAEHLARIYHDEIEYLHNHLGGYASIWFEATKKILEGVS